jgi:hypothetical protein
MLACTDAAFDGPMILFKDVIQVRYRSMAAIVLQSLFGFESHAGG